jgi:transcriptional regulator with XRE-family HTH domain
MTRLADRLRELREQAGLTQAALAQSSGLPVGSVRNYEQGQRDPPWYALFRIAGALGVSVERFADCAPNVAKQAKKKPRKGRRKEK